MYSNNNWVAAKDNWYNKNHSYPTIKKKHMFIHSNLLIKETKCLSKKKQQYNILNKLTNAC